MLKEFLISANLYTFQLIIVPVFLEYVFYIHQTLFISRIQLVFFRAIGAHKAAQPDQGVCACILLAIDAELVEGLTDDHFFQETFELRGLFDLEGDKFRQRFFQLAEEAT